MSEETPQDAQASSTPAPAKLDPESLVLRGTPRRVVRFRRGAIVLLTALGSTALVGVTWLALKPAALHIVASGDDSATPTAKATPDTLAKAPRTYGDVPKLGGPLPGDLGRPMLDQQQAAGMAAPGADQEAEAMEAERQRVAAERKAARESGVMVQVAGAGGTGLATIASAVTGGQATVPAATSSDDGKAAHLALDPDHDPNGQQRKADFMASKDDKGDLNPHSLVRPTSPYTLTAGTVIAASLITGLNSDLPGMVTAQITENAFDTVSGRYLLIPQGSRLIGSYDSVVAFGQKRALVVWQRIILPDGSSIRIDNVPATDTAGYAGLADKVDFHTWQLLKGVVLSSLLGVGTQLSFGNNESDLVRAIRESTQQSAGNAGNQLVGHALNIQPTITVRPGWPLRVVVNKDIVLPSAWQGR